MRVKQKEPDRVGVGSS